MTFAWFVAVILAVLVVVFAIYAREPIDDDAERRRFRRWLWGRWPSPVDLYGHEEEHGAQHGFDQVVERVERGRKTAEALLARADRLLQDDVIDRSVKAAVVDSIRDLEQGSRTLDDAVVANPDSARLFFKFADHKLGLASRRLDKIDRLIKRHGPTVKIHR